MTFHRFLALARGLEKIGYLSRPTVWVVFRVGASRYSSGIVSLQRLKRYGHVDYVYLCICPNPVLY